MGQDKDKIMINGAPPYDGEYEFDPYGSFSLREAHTMKRISGYTQLEIPEAGRRGDTDILVAFAVIALQRAGHIRVNEDVLWDAPQDGIEYVPETLPEGTKGEDAVPPPSSAADGDTRKPSGSVSSDASERHQGSDPSSTGALHSVTGAV